VYFPPGQYEFDNKPLVLNTGISFVGLGITAGDVQLNNINLTTSTSINNLTIKGQVTSNAPLTTVNLELNGTLTSTSGLFASSSKFDVLSVAEYSVLANSVPKRVNVNTSQLFTLYVNCGTQCNNLPLTDCKPGLHQPPDLFSMMGTTINTLFRRPIITQNAILYNDVCLPGTFVTSAAEFQAALLTDDIIILTPGHYNFDTIVIPDRVTVIAHGNSYFNVEEIEVRGIMIGIYITGSVNVFGSLVDVVAPSRVTVQSDAYLENTWSSGLDILGDNIVMLGGGIRNAEVEGVRWSGQNGTMVGVCIEIDPKDKAPIASLNVIGDNFTGISSVCINISGTANGSQQVPCGLLYSDTLPDLQNFMVRNASTTKGKGFRFAAWNQSSKQGTGSMDNFVGDNWAQYAFCSAR
jgi:hypothetical protein